MRVYKSFAEFCIRWKKQPKDHHAKALRDPWVFKEDINSIEFPFSSTQKNALLHLVHPRHFEPITSKGDKRDVARSFSNLLSRSSHDIDKDLLSIRSELSDTYGESFHLYDEDKRFVWDTSMSVLERFVRWGYRFVEHETFNELEIEFKLKPAERIGEARRAFESGANDWLSLLNKAFRQQALVPYYTYDSFLKWCTESQPDARLALREIWNADLDIEEAIRGFSSRFLNRRCRRRGYTDKTDFISSDGYRCTQIPHLRSHSLQSCVRSGKASPARRTC